MNPHAQSLAALTDALTTGEPLLAIAWVVNAHGRTRHWIGRYAGAHADGRLVGTLDDLDVARNVGAVASVVSVARLPRVVAFDVGICTEPRDYSGSLTLLVEPVLDRSLPEAVAFMSRCHAKWSRGVLATVFGVYGNAHVRIGDRLLVDEHGICEGALAAHHLAVKLRREARTVLRRRHADILSYGVPGCAVDVSLAYVPPPDDGAEATQPTVPRPPGSHAPPR